MRNSDFLIIIGIIIIVCLLTGCDKINNASRTMDTMLGGNYEVHVGGCGAPYYVEDGKITSVPEKGYYIFYPLINGKETLVQSPINSTTIIKID